jgi:hypothetical protein
MDVFNLVLNLRVFMLFCACIQNYVANFVIVIELLNDFIKLYSIFLNSIVLDKIKDPTIGIPTHLPFLLGV